MKNNNYFISLLMITIAFAAGLFMMRNKYKNQLEERKELISSLNDTIKTWKDKNGNSVSEISLLQTSKVNDFLEIQSKDKEIQELQAIVKDNKSKLGKQGSVTNITTNTKADISAVTKTDTVIIDNTKHIVYKSNFNLKNWITGNVIAAKDSTKINLSVKNQYSVILGEEGSFFSKKKPYIKVINYNPYSETKSLRAYQVQDTRAKLRFNWSLYLGAGVTYSKGEFIPGPQVGAGATISFK